MSDGDSSQKEVLIGMYLNQLPPTEVARLKAELAETLIANFCYPRFYDYRANALRMRPVDRAKRQEVWQYLNAVDFNVWGRVDVDSPDFQHQIERLFIHFVQRNRSFFGQQGRKRMTDVRTLIAGCSTVLAEGLRGHLRGQQESQPFGSPRPAYFWSAAKGTGQVDLPWEQVLSTTMQVQQQLQEARGEVRPASGPMPSTPPAAGRVMSGSVPTRRPRPTSPATATNSATSHGNGLHEDQAMAWPPAAKKPGSISGEIRSMPAPFPDTPQEAEAARPGFPPFPSATDPAPTMPMQLGKIENASAGSQPSAPPDVLPTVPARSRRGRAAEAASAAPTSGASGSPPRTLSQPLTAQAGAPSARTLQSAASPMPGTDLAVKQAESATVLASDEDVVIFEQMRYQLVLWLRVEVVRSGIELSGQGAFQLVDALRHQDGVDAARLQVVATLLNMCDQIITAGHASLFDYKQAMMYYLMHTRRSQ
jgi:hypothetical protein